MTWNYWRNQIISAGGSGGANGICVNTDFLAS
jgi:hypothetical protein